MKAKNNRLVPDDFEALIAAAERSVADLSDKLVALRQIEEPADRQVDKSVAVGVAKRLYRLRRMRDRYFEAGIFGEPAWDILLSLYIARAEKRPVSTTDACLDAAVPTTTALRWLTKLEKEGHVRRHPAEDDDRVVLIEVTEGTFDRLSKFFMAIGDLSEPI